MADRLRDYYLDGRYEPGRRSGDWIEVAPPAVMPGRRAPAGAG